MALYSYGLAQEARYQLLWDELDDIDEHTVVVM